MANCFSCLRGFHKTCRSDSNNPCECDHDLKDKLTVITAEQILTDDDLPEPVKNPHRLKRDQSLRDQQSTGRKRAARMYPLQKDQPCQWFNQRNVGGGTVPIIGCGIDSVPGLQQNRHHGPDKNTLNNEPGNVWLICARCHNTWHSKNDENYDPYKKLAAD